MSSNPFRKKGSQPDGASRFPPIEAIDTSRAQTQRGEMESSDNKENRESRDNMPQQPVKSSMREEQIDVVGDDRKAKVVKRVRVLSPPPLSPDSPEWPSHAAPPGMQGYDYNYNYAARQDDPFDAASTDDSDRDSSTATPTPPEPPPQQQQQQQQQGSSTAPPNPFAKTLQDMEGAEELEKERREEGEALKAANTQGASLDVDAFRRLLLTGKANPDRPTPPPIGEEPRTGGHADPPDTFSTPKAPADSSLNDSSQGQMSSQDPSETQQDYAEESEKKTRPPPPPPSSRHGRALKSEQKEDQSEPAIDNPKRVVHTDANKPPSVTPARAGMDDDTDSPFDHETAGKVPEQEVPDISAVVSPNSGKKAAPAPPPRRGHGRSDTKGQAPGSQGAEEVASLAPRGEDTTPRSSIDSTSAPTRTDSMRPTTNAPAPPPPRRPLPGPRQAVGITSPSVSTSSVPPALPPPVPHAESDHRITTLGASPPREATKASAPPPPPARNTSIRRPTSVSSVDGISRRISGEGKPRDSARPPPPPPRQRGSSPSTVEGVSHDRVLSAQSAEPGASTDILADLTALQREVDALRGKMN